MKNRFFLLLLFAFSAATPWLQGAAPLGLPDKQLIHDANALVPANEFSAKVNALVTAAKERRHGVLAEYCDMVRSSAAGLFPQTADESLSPRDATIRDHLHQLAKLVLNAEVYADEALVAPGYDKRHFHTLIAQAVAIDHTSHSLAVEAVELITEAWSRADALVKTREAVFDQYQDEIRRGAVTDGTRLAWSLIRIGSSHPDTRVVPGSFRHDAESAEIRLTHLGGDVRIHLTKDDLRERFRAEVDGYTFRSGWAVLFQKPLGWMVRMAKDMASAGVTPDYHREWEIMEAPEGLIALAASPEAATTAPLRAFYQGALREVTLLPVPADAEMMTQDFVAAAKALHEGVMADESIPQTLRAALNPVLMGTYQPVDARDYFDNAFCRRLIEADYLEAHVDTLSPDRQAELDRYRQTLARIENGVDRFSVDTGDGARLVAVAKPEIDTANGTAAIRDTETGETLSRYEWRLETDDATSFHTPLPGRQFYAMSVLDRYNGRHASRPKGVPASTEVWHAVLGRVASYDAGAEAAEGDADKWLEAVTLDALGRRDTVSGPMGWNFPLFVPVLDDQGDPVLIATARGTVSSPDFSAIEAKSARRAAQDEWLDHAANILAEPGELALIYKVFFRYCSDSPLPEMPNLIGSHYGLSDTHQTVYESLERRWVGRLIGDCDDLAEFFQALAIRQGKLSHVMQLPAHAAAGWLEEDGDGYQFIVLQTGPVLRFTDSTRLGAVEKAYGHFDDDSAGGFTAAAVPLLLRFADEETRTPFVLSARIYWDREYAEEMITVQEYWHLHTYSAGVAVMEEMVEHDRDAGNLKELASLYERVGRYDKADSMRREELAASGDDVQAVLSTHLDLAQLHIRSRDKAKAMESLATMEERFRDMREKSPAQYKRVASFRYGWASLLVRLGEPERAWNLLRLDVEEAGGSLSDQMLRTLVGIYDRMSIQRDSRTDAPAASARGVRLRFSLRGALEQAFGKGYFKEDDSYNKLHTRYFWLGRYGVAVAGRAAGLESLWLDGPYPAGARAHAEREADLDEADWEWFRVMPRLYLAFGLEMLDEADHPELFDPEAARRSLELVPRAMEKAATLGTNLMGRDAVIKSGLVLSFLNNDLRAFKDIMAEVTAKNYSSLYDDAAMTFGMYCGFVPIAEFGDLLDEFRNSFPGRQHYFKAAYRAMDKGHLDHADMLADRTAAFFPDEEVFQNEARALKEATARLRGDSDGDDGWRNDWADRERRKDYPPVPTR
ncbi:MAG: hypothetical protein LUC93_06405, partial [Planctomycetaceae bacterium]|nr:hypothetical protein [Planctomycetaceae bacterium]